MERNWNGSGRRAIYDRFPNLWWVENDWTYNGMFPEQEAIEIKHDLARHGGALGKHLSDVIGTVLWADNFVRAIRQVCFM